MAAKERKEHKDWVRRGKNEDRMNGIYRMGTAKYANF